MASATTSVPSPSLLQRRLSALRRRLYFVVSFRGLCWLLAFVLGTTLFAGLLDWQFQLPGLVRAVFLVSGLGTAGVLAFRLLLQPLAQRTDDLSLALRVEEHYPGFRDALASAVEFLQEPEDSDRMGSPSMRREAVRRSMRSVQKCDFNRVIDSRGLRTAGASFLGAALIGLALILLHPPSAWTAMVRLAVPFGSTEWPKKTLIELDKFRDRIGRTEGFEVRGRLTGVIPEQARVVFRLQGGAQIELLCAVELGEEGVGRFSAALRPGQVQRDFEFYVEAGDNSTRPQRISVLPPPVLVPLDGAASPQVRLAYPPYTDLPDLELPDGSGNVEAVAGTVVTLRAAMDRPMGRAWIEQKPENRYTPLGLGLAPLGSATPLDAVLLATAGPAVWGRAEARREGDPRQFTIRFQPNVSGIYELHFEDETGLPGQRIFELRIFPDPSPEVKLERPRAGRDSLDLLPNAELPLVLSVEDPQYAVRSSWLQYRCKKDDPPRRLPLFDHRTAAVGAAALQAALARHPVAPKTTPVLFKPGRVPITSRLLLAQLRHLDGSLLKEGDVLTVQALANDFDDVAVDKVPGKSHEVEIRIISRNALEVILNQEQAKVQQELVRLREQQREAIKKVSQTEQAMRKDGRLDPEELAKLVEAEQAQEQVRERVGDREEGLRGEVERILETLKNNQIERSATQERMEQVQRELERLAREDLEQVEPRLTAVRKQNEAAERKPEASKQDQEMLREARERQEEVEKTLSDLLSRMEPWTSTREIKGEVRSLLQEQKKLAEETRAMQDKGAEGKKREELTDAERAELNRLQEAQRKLEERTAQLLDKMDRVAQERREKDPETAQELENARQAGQESNITGQMQDARSKLERNQLSNAHRDQQDAARKLEDLARQLEDRREDELDRMVKKLREAERELERMGDEQEKLQKKAKELQQKLAKTSDPMEQKKLQEELKRLGREQEQLQKDAEEMVKRLSRMRSERSSQAMAKAAEALKRAGEAMARGENNDQEQDEALERIDEAAEELQRNREEAEEELAREQLAKVAETLKAFRERQAALIGEAGRLQNESLRRKEWTRGLRISLGDLSRAQKGLGDEVQDVAKERLGGAPVFAKVLRKAADAMDRASKRMLERQQELGLNPDDTKADDETATLQQEGLRRLTQLLDAIKEEENRGPRGGGGGGGGGGGEGGGGGGGDGDSIPPLAQLKLLHDLQAEVNRQTADFVKKHPDVTKLNDKEKAELRDIQREQKEIAELLEALARPAEPEPEPMDEKKENKKEGMKP